MAKIKITLEIDEKLYNMVKNLESIEELRYTNKQLENMPVTLDCFIEKYLEKLFDYSSIDHARKFFIFEQKRKTPLHFALQKVESLFSKRIRKQIEKENLK